MSGTRWGSASIVAKEPRNRHRTKTWIWLALALAALAPIRAAESTERWGEYEAALQGPRAGNPFVDVQFRVQFQSRNRVGYPSLWDTRIGFTRVAAPITQAWFSDEWEGELESALGTAP